MSARFFRRSSRWMPPAVAVVAGIVYTVTRSRHYSEAEDALRYIHEVTHGGLEQWLHPQHLIFNLLQRAGFEVWRWFGHSGNAEPAMVTLNLFAGSAALGLLVSILLRLKVTPRLALLAVVLTGTSFGFWHYTTVADTYILPLAAALFSLDRALALLQCGRGRDWLLLGLGLVLTVLLHQQHALFAVILTLSLGGHLLLRDRPGPGKVRDLARLAVTAGAAALLILGAYLGVGVWVFERHSAADLLQWILGYASDGAWTAWSITSPVQAMVGAGRAVVGGHALFACDTLATGFARLFPGKLLVEETFLVATLGPVRLAAYFVLLGLALAATLLLIARLVGLRRPASATVVPPEWAWAGLTALAVLAVYGAFNTWWEPANPEFWIFTLPFLALLVTLRLQALQDTWSLRLALVTISAIATANLIGSIQPMHDRERDYWYAVNRDVLERLREGDALLTNGGYISDAMLRLYGPAEIIAVRDLPAGELAGIVLERAQADVLASAWVAEPPVELLASRQVRARPEVMQTLEAYGRWVPVFGPDTMHGLWRLQR